MIFALSNTAFLVCRFCEILHFNFPFFCLICLSSFRVHSVIGSLPSIGSVHRILFLLLAVKVSRSNCELNRIGFFHFAFVIDLLACDPPSTETGLL